MVSNNINQYGYNNINYQGAAPTMTSGEAEKLKQSVDNSYISNRVKASKESSPLQVAGFTAGMWYLLSQVMDKFGEKCKGDYGNSALGKLGNWGDNVHTKFVNTAVGKQVAKGYHAVGNLWHRLTGKNKLIYAMKNTPGQAEWKLARSSGAGLKGYLAMDTDQLFGYFMKPINHVQKLEQFGYSQDQINKFAETIKNLKGNDRALAFAKEELRALGVDNKTIQNVYANGKGDITKGIASLNNFAEEVKAKALGFKNLGEYKTVMSDSIENADKILDALKNSKNADKLCISVKRGNTKAGKLKGNLFGRKIYVSELRNKFMATLGKGNKTKLGRILPKAAGYFLEGTTNRFAGGKLAVLMQAAIFGDMLANSINAPKGEKFKTLAERFVNDFSYFIALPFGCMAMHAVGGMKYAGMSKAEVSAYRTRLKQFRADVKAGLYAGNKAAFKAENNALKQMLKGNVKNPITKLFKKIGSLIEIGNECRPSYVSAGKLGAGNLLRKIPNFMRNVVGVPIRLLIPLAVITPLFAKVFTKAENKIFGKPSKSVLDEEDTTNKEQPKEAPQSNPQENPFTKPIEHNSPSNLINMYKNGQAYNNSTSTTNNTVVNNNIVNKDNAEDDNKVLEPVRTYIPSPMGVQLKGEDTSAADAAIARSMAAEKQAMETLAMKW